MTRARLTVNATVASVFLIVGAKWYYQGAFRKTGDIADIYVRYLGVAAMGLGALGLLSLGLRLYLARRKRGSDPESRP